MAVSDISDLSLHSLTRLDGKRAVITGGAQGIGLAIAERFAEAGASVLIADLDGTAARMSAADLARRHGGVHQGTTLDVRKSEDFGSIGKMAEAAGGIDIWVNNAGIYPPCSLDEMTEENWDLVNDINLRGCFLGCRLAARLMSPPLGAGGVILSVASVSGLRGRANLAHYVASKHGVVGLTRALGIELAPQGIRVLALAPTLIVTPGVEAAQANSGGDSGDAYRAFLDRLGATIPLGRAGVPDDVARVALFAVSGLAHFMTGCTIPVDGGAIA